MQEALGARRDWVYVDVGANKGYAIGEMLSLLVEDSNVWSPMTILKNFVAFLPNAGKPCGACCDCRDPQFDDPLPKPIAANSLCVFAFDLSIKCIEFLAKQFGDKVLPTHVSVKPLNVGVNHAEGTIMLAESMCGEMNSLESGSTQRKNQRQAEVAVKPLVQLLPEGVHIDFLSTDTEGHDHNVFYGSRDLFVSRRVSVYLFEVHHKASPAHARYTTLRGMIEDLDSLEYDCFFPVRESKGHAMLVRVTGCKDTVVEKLIGWRNLLCYARWNSTLRGVFERLESTQHDSQKHIWDKYSKCQGRWWRPYLGSI